VIEQASALQVDFDWLNAEAQKLETMAARLMPQSREAALALSQIYRCRADRLEAAALAIRAKQILLSFALREYHACDAASKASQAHIPRID
jgi:hypothetical protein